MRAEVDQVQEVLLGIGMDVNLEAEDFPAPLRQTATSLSIQTGQKVNRAELAVAILRELDHDYKLVVDGQFKRLAGQWEERCTTLGCQVAIRFGDRVIRGRAESLDDDGALLVRGTHGHLERIVGGDVTVEKMD
jgi:BirA family biotin operon repressor/biotin-[acetyl-CoA-carboxylase] ligase